MISPPQMGQVNLRPRGQAQSLAVAADGAAGNEVLGGHLSGRNGNSGFPKYGQG